jgi:hypothetical protein
VVTLCCVYGTRHDAIGQHLAERFGVVFAAASLCVQPGRERARAAAARARRRAAAWSSAKTVDDLRECRKLALWWGVVPIHQQLAIDEMLGAEAMGKHLVRTGRARPGHRVVLVGVHDQVGEGPRGVVAHLVLGPSD